MLNNIPKYIIRFIVLVLLQVLILDNVYINGYINPYLYILFILILPFEVSGITILSLSFLLGFTIDLFTQTIGMHISATLFLAFMRKYVLQLISPREGYDFGLTPTLQDMGFVWFITYALLLTFLHHVFLFMVEALKFSEFFTIMGRAFLSTLFTVVLILIAQVFMQKRK